MRGTPPAVTVHRRRAPQERGGFRSFRTLVGFALLGVLVVSLLREDLAVAVVDLHLLELAVVTGDLDLPDHVAVLVAEFGVLGRAEDRLEGGLLGGLLVNLGEAVELLSLLGFPLLLFGLVLRAFLALCGFALLLLVGRGLDRAPVEGSCSSCLLSSAVVSGACWAAMAAPPPTVGADGGERPND
jgi:hypothetical protein